MKLSDGFSRLLPSVLIFVFYGFAFVALTLSLRRIDLAVTYAIWSGPRHGAGRAHRGRYF